MQEGSVRSVKDNWLIDETLTYVVKKPRLKATTRSLSPSRRRHLDLERHVGTRYEATDLRSRPGRRDFGVLPRAVRQDPRQPRAGEQNMERRLQDCRCVPSQVQLRRVTAHVCLEAESYHTPVGQR